MKWLNLVFILLVPTVSNAEHQNDNHFSKDHCAEIYKGIQFLLSEADKHWELLNENPEGSKQFIEDAMRIQWLADVAGNYSTVYQTFCSEN